MCRDSEPISVQTHAVRLDIPFLLERHKLCSRSAKLGAHQATQVVDEPGIFGLKHSFNKASRTSHASSPSRVSLLHATFKLVPALESIAPVSKSYRETHLANQSLRSSISSCSLNKSVKRHSFPGTTQRVLTKFINVKTIEDQHDIQRDIVAAGQRNQKIPKWLEWFDIRNIL
jgi:hypothetical protein